MAPNRSNGSYTTAIKPECRLEQRSGVLTDAHSAHDQISSTRATGEAFTASHRLIWIPGDGIRQPERADGCSRTFFFTTEF